MIRGIHHIAINVRDLDRMLAFYCEGMGFVPTHAPRSWRGNALIDAAIDVKGSAGRSAILRAGNCYLELAEYSAPQPAATAALRPFDNGYTHFCIDVTNIAETCERLKRYGMTFHDDPVDFGPAQAIFAQDPEGNLVEVQEIENETGLGIEGLELLSQ
jgi:catechol 2,3-dioxygenase-like lactoylglutathione lyase family enzyme